MEKSEHIFPDVKIEYFEGNEVVFSTHVRKKDGGVWYITLLMRRWRYDEDLGEEDFLEAKISFLQRFQKEAYLYLILGQPLYGGVVNKNWTEDPDQEPEEIRLTKGILYPNKF